MPEDNTDWNAKLTQLARVWDISPSGDSTPLSLNIEEAEDQSFVSKASAFITIHEYLKKLPSLLDIRSAHPILDREDRFTTVLTRTSRRLPMNWAGKWVVIRDGEYQGAVGFVRRPGPDVWVLGGRDRWVDVLVIPRVFNDPTLREYAEGTNGNGKRRAVGSGEVSKRLRSEGNSSGRPLEPRLLVDREGLTITNEGRDRQVYEQFGNRAFATDLELIRVRAKHVTLALMTPWPVRLQYLASENQEIDTTTLPPPTIVKLEPEERIIHVPTRWIGYMLEWRGEDIAAYNVVDGTREERLVPASETHKYFDVGEYVEVVIHSESSTDIAGSGWVIQNTRGSLLEIFDHRLTPEGHRGEASFLSM